MCDECGWEDVATTIDELLEDSEYDWARDTLEGIQEWVSENEHCTPGQEQAVKNISNSGS